MITNREAIVGAAVIADSEVLTEHAVLVSNGRIDGVVRAPEVPSDYSTRDVGPGLLAPGFIDIHTHGAGGFGFDETDPASRRQALEIFRRAGVTTLLPTIASAPLEHMVAVLQTYETVRSDVGATRTPGVHLEGPYFSPQQRGAQDLRALRTPDDGSVDRLLEHAAAICMISFAPELPGAVALTERLVEIGIVAAAGHSDGRDTDLAACQRAGLSHVIHIVSGQSTTAREGPWRLPGMFEASLASDGLTVEMIADGVHLPATLMRLVTRCLPGRLCVVSDSIAGAGLPDGRFRLGDEEYVVRDGVGMTLDGSSFAGSTTLLPHMLPTVVEQIGMSIPDAVAMFTSVPAAAARLPDVGRIAAGYYADFVVLDESLRVRAVAIDGKWN